MEIMRKLTSPYLLVPLICLVFYSGLMTVGGSVDFSPDLNYFRDLADAFRQGRLDVHVSRVNDLVLYNNKYYLYWPPAPALAYYPLVVLFGMNLPDAFINVLFGTVNVFLVMMIGSKLSERFSLQMSAKGITWLGILWGLGTVHFYMSMEGTVWFVSQIMAQSFLLAAIFFFLKNQRWWLPGLFFALAVYTRNHLVFSLIFFCFLYRAINPHRQFKEMIPSGVLFLVPFFIATVLNGWYNYARFGNVLDNGINYHLMADYFAESFKQHGYFSIYYFPNNFYKEVLHFPTTMLRWPFIKYQPDGFGFVWASPVFLLLVPALFLLIKGYFKSNAQPPGTGLIIQGSLLSSVPIACVIFMVMGTGWVQFGARYTLDFHFFLIIFLMFSWRSLTQIPYMKYITVALIGLSVAVEYIGAYGYK